MNSNVVYPADIPPAYSEQPLTAASAPTADGPSSSAPAYDQSTLLHNDPGKQPPAQSTWADPAFNQCPPPAYGQYPAAPGPPASYDPYGQPPVGAAYPPPPGAPPYYGGPPAPQQQQQQQVVVVQGGPQPVLYRQSESFIAHMILACFVMWCCNWIFGLVAFILAVVATNTSISDPSCARQLGHASWGVSAAGIIVTILVVIIVVAVLVSAAAQAAATASSSVPVSSCSSLYFEAGGKCYLYRKYVGSSGYNSCGYGYYYKSYCYYNSLLDEAYPTTTHLHG